MISQTIMDSLNKYVPLHSLLARLATKLGLRERGIEATREAWLGTRYRLLYQQFMMGKCSQESCNVPGLLCGPQ